MEHIGTLQKKGGGAKDRVYLRRVKVDDVFKFQFSALAVAYFLTIYLWHIFQLDQAELNKTELLSNTEKLSEDDAKTKEVLQDTITSQELVISNLERTLDKMNSDMHQQERELDIVNEELSKAREKNEELDKTYMIQLQELGEKNAIAKKQEIKFQVNEEEQSIKMEKFETEVTSFI